MNTTIKTAVALTLCAAFGQSTMAQCRVTELETQPGWQARANSLTPKGMVVGRLETADRTRSRPAQWTSEGRLTLLPHDAQDAVAWVSDANDTGALVGQRGAVFDGHLQAVKWTAQGAVPLSTALASSVDAVNRQGVAVGFIVLPDGTTYQAKRWAKDGTDADLPGLDGRWTVALSINRVGQIVGLAGDAAGRINAVSWSSKGELRVLPSLGGAFTLANRISESSTHVVGMVNPNPSSFDLHAALWRNGLDLVYLGTLGGSFGSAHGVNKQEVVVGASATSTGQSAAFVWRAGTMTDLNTMAPKRFLNAGNRLDSAARISDQGVILASAVQSTPGQPDSIRSVILKRCLE